MASDDNNPPGLNIWGLLKAIARPEFARSGVYREDLEPRIRALVKKLEEAVGETPGTGLSIGPVRELSLLVGPDGSGWTVCVCDSINKPSSPGPGTKIGRIETRTVQLPPWYIHVPREPGAKPIVTRSFDDVIERLAGLDDGT